MGELEKGKACYCSGSGLKNFQFQVLRGDREKSWKGEVSLADPVHRSLLGRDRGAAKGPKFCTNRHLQRRSFRGNSGRNGGKGEHQKKKFKGENIVIA